MKSDPNEQDPADVHDSGLKAGTLVPEAGQQCVGEASEVMTAAKPEPLLIYGTPYCPMVPPVLRLLEEMGVAYTYIDIRKDREAATRVREIAGGNESVPTLVFPDGKTMVEPGVRALLHELQDRGQEQEPLRSTIVAAKASLSNPMYLILVLIGLALVVAVMLSG